MSAGWLSEVWQTLGCDKITNTTSAALHNTKYLYKIDGQTPDGTKYWWDKLLTFTYIYCSHIL